MADGIPQPIVIIATSSYNNTGHTAKFIAQQNAAMIQMIAARNPPMPYQTQYNYTKPHADSSYVENTEHCLHYSLQESTVYAAKALPLTEAPVFSVMTCARVVASISAAKSAVRPCSMLSVFHQFPLGPKMARPNCSMRMALCVGPRGDPGARGSLRRPRNMSGVSASTWILSRDLSDPAPHASCIASPTELH